MTPFMVGLRALVFWCNNPGNPPKVTGFVTFPSRSPNGCWTKNRGKTPQIIHFNRVFHYKPSILGCHYFWKHPICPNLNFLFLAGSQITFHVWSYFVHTKKRYILDAFGLVKISGDKGNHRESKHFVDECKKRRNSSIAVVRFCWWQWGFIILGPT